LVFGYFVRLEAERKLISFPKRVDVWDRLCKHFEPSSDRERKRKTERGSAEQTIVD
jgi:hypothetical protein